MNQQSMNQQSMSDNSVTELYVDPSLVQEQMALEMGMKDAGIVRFRKMMANMVKTGQEDNTSYGDRIIGNYIEKVAAKLEAWVEEGRGKAGARRSAQPYIEALDYRVTAMLGLKCVIQQLMTEQARLSRTAVGIARLMEDELRCQSLRAQDKRAYNGIMKAAAKKGEYKRKVDVVRYLTKQDGNEWSRWNDQQCIHIGMVVINCIQSAVHLVEFYDAYDKKGRTLCSIRPSGDTASWVKEHIAKAMKFCNPMLEPTVIPPRPWIAGELKGGYHTDHIPRRPLVKSRNKAYLEELKYSSMPKVLQAVNAAQSTAWRINPEVLSLLQELSQRDSEIAGVPRATLYEIPMKPHDIDVNEESRRKYRGKAHKVHNDNVNLLSKRLSFLNVLQTAEKYAKYQAIYMPAQLDFRGRVYFMPQLNPQGPDWIKALLQFAEAKPLGEHGLEWMQIHIANLFGVDKVTYQERVQWVKDNTEMLLANAENPFDYTEWAEADDPFQAYAAAREYREALLSGNPETYHSRLAVALDGSCSGIQNLSLAFRDEKGGAEVNIVPTERPADIYKAVCLKSVIELERIVKEGAENGRDVENPHDTWKDPTDAQLAQWWLDYGMTRKVTKRNCMTFPYGSKQRGFSDQILEDTIDPFIKALTKETAQSNPLATLDERGEPTTLYNPMKLSNLLARLNYQSVKATVIKAAEAMDWMQLAARLVAKEGRPVCWITPLGLPVVQNYLQTKEQRVETSLAGERKVLSIREDTLKPDTRKAANSISPNVVHSLDASHLMLTVANADAAGIHSFALVHDSFGTHAGDTEEFYDIIRTSMIELYTDDVFTALRNNFLDQVHPDRHSEMPELPEHGNLDPEVVRESLYCFA